MKKEITGIIIVAMLFNVLATFVLASDIFPDLSIQQFDERGRPIVDKVTKQNVYEDHWASKDIIKSTKIGLIDGYRLEDGSYEFRPEQPITRAEFIKMAMVLSTNSTFDFDTIPADISHWAGKYVKVAEMQRVLKKGQYTDDNLDEPITRIEMISLLSNIQINMKGIPQNRQGTLPYTDIDRLTEEEKGLLLHAAKYELIKNMLSTTKFEPNKNLTRAEATVAIMRIY